MAATQIYNAQWMSAMYGALGLSSGVSIAYSQVGLNVHVTLNCFVLE